MLAFLSVYSNSHLDKVWGVSITLLVMQLCRLDTPQEQRAGTLGESLAHIVDTGAKAPPKRSNPYLVKKPRHCFFYGSQA